MSEISDLNDQVLDVNQQFIQQGDDSDDDLQKELDQMTAESDRQS